MKTLKIKTTGKSLKELCELYPKLFFDQSWYIKEDFYTEKPEAGEFEIVIKKSETNKTWKEQIDTLKKDEIVLHIAQYIEGMINEYNLTGKKIFENWWIRTNNIDSDGDRVHVGYFDSGGLSVGSWSDGGRSDDLGLSAARKLDLNPLSPDTFEPLKLESAIKIVKDNGYKVIKEL